MVLVGKVGDPPLRGDSLHRYLIRHQWSYGAHFRVIASLGLRVPCRRQLGNFRHD